MACNTIGKADYEIEGKSDVNAAEVSYFTA
jgi:hypothetical protein